MFILNQLAGFGVIPAGGLTSIAQQASASASSGTTITWPAVAAGDIAVLFDVAANASGFPTAVTPTGFTNMCNVTGSSLQRAMMHFKLCDGTETGTLTCMNGALVNRRSMVTFRGTPAITSATHGGAQNGSIGDTNPGGFTIASGSGVAPLIVVAGYYAAAAVDPRTFTVGGIAAKDGEISFISNFEYQAWKIYLSGPADVTIDMDDEGNRNTIQGAYISVS
jgi:hypothetical protein